MKVLALLLLVGVVVAQEYSESQCECIAKQFTELLTEEKLEIRKATKETCPSMKQECIDEINKKIETMRSLLNTKKCENYKILKDKENKEFYFFVKKFRSENPEATCQDVTKKSLNRIKTACDNSQDCVGEPHHPVEE